MLTESHDEEQIIARVAALDIGKAEVVCCVRVPAGANANSNGLSTCAAVMRSIRSSVLMRLCACFAFVAFARKRSMNACR